MIIFVYSAGSDFYIKMATMCCISHKRANTEDEVVFLTTEDNLQEKYVSCLTSENIHIHNYPDITLELSDICADGDMFRFHTFARWQCYLRAASCFNNEVHALLDPDIVSTECWSDIQKRLDPGTIAFTRQFDWDYFINGGFIVGYECDMKRIGAFFMRQIHNDVSTGAYIKLPYDQIYWNRFFNSMGLSNICVGNDFLQLSVEKKMYKSKLIHQIDYKGTLFLYPMMIQIAQDCNFIISKDDLERY